MFMNQFQTSGLKLSPAIITPDSQKLPVSEFKRRNAVSASVMTEEQATSYVKKVSKYITIATYYIN